MIDQTAPSDQVVPSWLPLGARRDYTQFKALREKGRLETRGRPTTRDEEQIVGLYIELEARCQVLSVSLLSFLKDIKLRVADGNAKRLPTPAERVTLRKYHSEGQRQVEYWRSIHFMRRGHPHPRITHFDRELKVRKEALAQLPPRELFILNQM